MEMVNKFDQLPTERAIVQIKSLSDSIKADL